MSLEVHAAASVHIVLWNEPPSGLLISADHTLKMETVSSHAMQYAESIQRTKGQAFLLEHLHRRQRQPRPGPHED
jgi:hypothetical protein